jgi:hypothetical protein
MGEQLNRAREQVGAYASEAADTARARAGGLIDDQKTAAADGLSDMSEALRQVSEQLRESSQAMIAGLTRSAADQIDQVAQTLRERDVSELIGDAREFARRQPELFFAGAVALGFLVARMIRSAGRGTQAAQPSTSASRAGGAPSAASQFGQGGSGSTIEPTGHDDPTQTASSGRARAAGQSDRARSPTTPRSDRV